MVIRIHKPELLQRVQKEIQSGNFHDMDELLTKALDALHAKENESDPKATAQPQRLIDALLAFPFVHSELYIPPRQKDFPRPVDL